MRCYVCMGLYYLLGEHRDIDIEVCSRDDVHINGKALLKVLPTTMEMVGEVELYASYWNSICCHQMSIYVALADSKVWKLDFSSGTGTGTVSVLNDEFEDHNMITIAVHNDKLYLLQDNGASHTVKIYELTGELIDSWKHCGLDCFYNQLTIAGRKIVVPVTDENVLRIYSLEGKTLKHISCKLLRGNDSENDSSNDDDSDDDDNDDDENDGDNGSIFLCTFDDETVILSSSHSAEVSKVNILTGEVVWTCADIVCPRAVCSYGANNVLVVEGCATINILNGKTG